MGITIEVYRSRIGSFLPNSNKCKVDKSRSRKNFNQRKYPTNNSLFGCSYLYLVPVVLAVTISSLLVAAYPTCSQSQSYKFLPLSVPRQLTPLLQIVHRDIDNLADSRFSMISNFKSRYLYGNKKTGGIRISHWNKGPGHLHTKLPEIKNIIDGLHPHVLGISESNLNINQDQNLSHIQDYNLHICPTRNNPDLKTSRVVVYTHKSLVVKVRTDLMCDTYSSIWLEVGLPKHKKFLVGQTYREWQLPNQRDQASLSIPEQLSRWTVFLEQWTRALDSGLEVHLLGDLNINHCNWTSTSLPPSNQTSKLRPLINALFTYILPHGVSQCVTGPTRHWPGQEPSGLDHYFTNRPEKLSPVNTQYCGGSDHMVIFATRYSKSMRTTPRYIRRRSYKDFNPEAFIAAIRQVSWLDIYLSDDVNTAVELLSSKISFILDTMAPMKSIQVRTKYSPWISKQTLGLMKERNNLQRIASETRNRDDWVKYKSLRNKINNRLKYEERSWQKFKLQECEGSPSKSWKNVKSILNWNTSGSPSQLFYQGRLVNKPQELADVQNQYFVDKINLLRQGLPPPVTDPLQTLKVLMQGRTCSFSLSYVHPSEVEQVISSLSNSASFGMDMIDTSTVKLISNDIVPALTHIINLSISSKTFPTSWKKAKIVPLHKKDDVLNPKNYRPVAILPIFSKVLERVIFNQVVTYLSENNLIHPNHHAYRPHHNTTTALLQMYDTWLESLEKTEMSGVCFLDMSAAFDIVDHSLLLKKLELYGLDSCMLDWVQSYLSGRSQCVCIDGTMSRLLDVKHGVPQGSILGPLLYTLFTNELPEVVHEDCAEIRVEDDDGTWPRYNMSCRSCGSVGCYADDTTYSCTGKDLFQLSEKLTDKYNTMSKFLISNRLKLNDDKTHLMVMTTSQARAVRKGTIKDSSLVVIRTPSKIIEPSESEKLLGCWLHQDMKFAEHLVNHRESLLRSLNQRIGALKLICKVANFKTRKMIADGIVMSKIIYLIELWGGSSKYLMEALQKAQNRAARFVTRLEWNTPTGELLKQCGWLSIQQLSVYHSVVLVYKVMLNKSPKYLYTMFSTKYIYRTSQAHNKILRQSRNFSLNITRDSFRGRAAMHYNQLPLDIRNSASIQQFKKDAKAWVRSNISIYPQ